VDEQPAVLLEWLLGISKTVEEAKAEMSEKQNGRT
jgi:penicillin V acylase-like amidase (Ntn superfamily)